MKRRQLLQQLAAAGLLANGGIMGFLQRALANGTNPVPPGLHKLKGTVTVNGAAAREGQLVKPGDTVVTGKDGEAIFVIEPGRLPATRRHDSQLWQDDCRLHARRHRTHPFGIRQGRAPDQVRHRRHRHSRHRLLHRNR